MGQGFHNCGSLSGSILLGPFMGGPKRCCSEPALWHCESHDSTSSQYYNSKYIHQIRSSPMAMAIYMIGKNILPYNNPLKYKRKYSLSEYMYYLYICAIIVGRCTIRQLNHLPSSQFGQTEGRSQVRDHQIYFSWMTIAPRLQTDK